MVGDEVNTGGQKIQLGAGDMKKLDAVVKALKKVNTIEKELVRMKREEALIQKKMDVISKKESKQSKGDLELLKQRLITVKTLTKTLESQRSGYVNQAKGGSKGSGGALQTVKTGALLGVGLLLVKGMSEMVGKSKILSTFMQQLGNILGLMLDLILIPFLPLLIAILLLLYKPLLALAKIWNAGGGGGSNNGTTSPGGFLNGGAPGSSTGAQAANDFIKGITGGLLNTQTLLALGAAIIIGLAAVLLGVSLGWAIVAAAIVGGIVMTLVPYAADLGSAAGRALYDAGYTFAEDIREKLLNPVYVFVQNLGSYWSQFSSNFMSTYDALSKKISDGISGVLSWWSGMFSNLGSWINDLGSAWNTLISSIKTWLSNLWSSIVNGVTGGVSGGISSLGKILGFSEGGIVPGPTGAAQLAVVHGGETVTPVGQSPQKISIVVQGYTDTQLQGKITNALRQAGARYKL